MLKKKKKHSSNFQELYENRLNTERNPFLEKGSILHTMLNFWPSLRGKFLRGSKLNARTHIFLTNAQQRKKCAKKHLLLKYQLKHLHSPYLSPDSQPPPLGLCPQLQIAWEMFISGTCWRMSSSSWGSLETTSPGRARGRFSLQK